ncbi:hypothetical protein ACFL6H_09480 [Candidatus Latescibacterota bacterium]
MSGRFITLAIAILISITYGTVVFSEPMTQTKTLDSNGIESGSRLINLRLDDTGGKIMLDDTELIEDDGPATGNPEGYDNNREWTEDLKKGVVIKKILMLDNPETWSGQLVFKAIEMKGNTTPLRISLNGVEFVRPASRVAYPFARQYIDLAGWDRWFYVDLPSGALVEGPNEIIMRAESEKTSWRILIALEQEFVRGSIERPHHPNRSMKSTDEGKTWNDNALGNMNSVDGEYSIRFSLKRHVSRGEYVSPVIDLVGRDCHFKELVEVSKAHIMFDTDIPEETDVSILMSFGSSPLSSDRSWSEWEKIDVNNGAFNSENKRYFRWKAELSTDNPLKSPVLNGIEISAEWNKLNPNEGTGIQMHLIRNGTVERSSYITAYEYLLHPGLNTYRDNHKLDRIVQGAESEFEIMMRLLNWAYRIPVSSEEYSWDWNKVTTILESSGDMPLLQMDYTGRRRDAMCLYSNQALIAALLSMGYQARHLNLHSEGVSGHEITEVWSNEFNKWIYMDATRDYYYFDKDTGIPLNMLEIHNLLKAEMPRVETIERPFVPEMGKEVVARINVGMREGDNKYSIVEDGRHILELMGYFRIIPRNDFLSNPYPVPVHTGNTMWGWSGFLNYYDETFPKRREYQIQTNRAVDFYEPLNQSEVFLSETNERGILNVEVDTFTPGGFDTFLACENEGEWKEQKANKWQWMLKSGLNSMKIRTKNVRGVLGPVSHLNVTFNP